MWINNYYRQQYNNPNLPPIPPGYTEADPKGWNVAAGFRWEYRPEAGFLEVRAGYALDVVAPGYELDTSLPEPLIRGEDRLYTPSLKLSFENVLGTRWRLLNEMQLSDTTERELRFSWQGSLNFAPRDRWVLRSYVGYTTEQPKFEAW